MKTVPLSVLVLAVLLGSASAGITAYLLFGPEPAGLRATAPHELEAAVAGPTPELFERIDALTEENRELRSRLASLELRPAPDYQRVPVEGFVSKETFAAFRDEVRAMLESRVAAPTPEPRELREQVAGALIEIRQKETFDKVRQYQEQRSERLEEDLAEMTGWLSLENYQVKEMRGILRAQYDREDELRRLWEEGTDDELLGERKTSDRELFRGEVESVLSPEQFETFWTRVGGGGKD